MCDDNESDPNPKLDAIEALGGRQNDIDAAKDSFLRKHGWTYSSSYPDHCWRWSKIVDGQRITEATNGAIRIEECLP